MKAVLYDRYGPPEVLSVGEVERATPGDDELLIRVRAAEATKSDVEMRSFEYAVKWFWLPLRLALGVRAPRRRILGSYFAGVVEGVGAAVTHFSPGDEVFGSSRLRLGAYAQHLVVPERYTVVRKPTNMTFAEAAAVPLGGLNALHFMRLANVQPGQAVVINGAGGSIGLYAVQIAKAMGAEVTAVDEPIKEAVLRRLGADHFVDYTKADFTAHAAGYDVVFDMVPDSDYRACLRALKPGGRYLSGNPRLSTMVRAVWTSRLTDRIARIAFARETREELSTLREMIEAGRIGSIVDRVLPMEEAAAAHRLVGTEERVGAIVIAID